MLLGDELSKSFVPSLGCGWPILLLREYCEELVSDSGDFRVGRLGALGDRYRTVDVPLVQCQLEERGSGVDRDP
jgi:hypothetical protein